MIDFLDRHIGDRKPTDKPDDCQFPGSKKLPYELPSRCVPMKLLALSVIVLALVAPAGAQAQLAFERPDCPCAGRRLFRRGPLYSGHPQELAAGRFPTALQKTGLIFKYMARPEVDKYPAAKAALEQKVEGSFTVRFSVAPDGAVYNVATTDVTGGIEPLAKMWADTIGEWTVASRRSARR